MIPANTAGFFAAARVPKAFLISLLVIHVVGCASVRPIAIDDLRNASAASPLSEGDRVEVLTRSGEKLEFTVTEINAQGLGGQFGFVHYADMRRLGVRRPGEGIRSEWIWTAVGVAALIALLAAADSVTACSPGPCPTE